MNSEQLMNQQRMALLKTIQKENPSLRLYMTDLLYEMEEPESTFNTGKISRWSDLDKLTAMRLCDAFAVSKKYSEKYHLDLPELIEFVSEKTLEILSEDKHLLTTPFKEQIKYLIRQQFPLQNALLSRNNRQNMQFYLMYDKDNRNALIDETEHYCDTLQNEVPELNIPILFTQNPNVAYAKMERNLEMKEAQEKLSKALEVLNPREKEVINLRFGFDGETAHDLETIGERLNLPRNRVRAIEAKAIRKLHSPKLYLELRMSAFLLRDDVSYTPIGRGIDYSSSLPLMAWLLKSECKYTSPCKHAIRCICGGKVSFKHAAGQKILICQNCGNIYPVKNKRQSNQ